MQTTKGAAEEYVAAEEELVGQAARRDATHLRIRSAGQKSLEPSPTYTTRSYAGMCRAKNASSSSPKKKITHGISAIHAKRRQPDRRTFAHVGAAAHGTRVLGPAGVNAPPELEEPGRGPLGGVGDDLVEHRVQALVLRSGSVRRSSRRAY